MTRSRGFTLFEVLAAVVILGLIYTVLAEVAMRGLRSEGIDRRRAEASLLADARLTEVEAMFAAGAALPEGVVESEVEPYRIVLEVAAENLIGMLPPELGAEVEAQLDESGGASLLRDDQGLSQLQRVTVLVEWDESGELHRVVRTTHAFDATAVAASIPAAGEEPVGGALDEGEQEGADSLESALERGGGSGSGGSDLRTSGGGGSQPSRIDCASLGPGFREFVEKNGGCR